MIDALIINLLSAGLTSSAGAQRKKVEQKLRQGRYEHALGEVGSEFNDVFKQSLKRAAQDLDNEELLTIAIHWDIPRIAESLDDVSLIFQDEEDAVERIVVAIESDPDIELNETTRDGATRAVTQAYRAAIGEFKSRIAGTELGDELQIELGIDIANSVNAIDNRLERLEQEFTPRRRFWRLDFPAEHERAVETLLGDRYTTFVSRSEMTLVEYPPRLLILGPAGAGKTRMLGAVLEQIDDDSIEHVILPKQDLNFPGDARRLESESFDGDVLLVWDDIHRINEQRDNRVFEEVVDTLEAVLEEQGFELRLLLTARSGNVSEVPGDVINKQGMWKHVQILRLGEMDEVALGRISDNLAEFYDVDLPPASKRKLIERAAGISAPLYIETAIQSVGSGTLTETDIADLADSAHGIWRSHYESLGEEDDAAMAVLEASKLWFDLYIRRYSSLVRGVYLHVLDQQKRSYRDAVHGLIDRQWLDIQGGSDPFSADAFYRFHDVQLEAVNQHVVDYLPELSDFLQAEARRYVGPFVGASEDEKLAGLNLAFGLMVDALKVDGSQDYVRKHLETAIGLDESNPMWVYEYGRWLHDNGEYDEAAEKFRMAIELDQSHAYARTGLAILLYEGKISSPDGNRFEQAVEELRTAIKSDPTEANAITTLANILKQKGHTEQAERLYKRAIAVNSGTLRFGTRTGMTTTPAVEEDIWPYPRLNYALFLARFERFEEAEQQFEKAIEESPNSGIVLSQFGPILMQRGKDERAERILLQALEKLEDDYLIALTHFHLASLYTNQNRFEKATEHLRTLYDEYPEETELIEDRLEPLFDR